MAAFKNLSKKKRVSSFLIGVHNTQQTTKDIPQNCLIYFSANIFSFFNFCHFCIDNCILIPTCLHSQVVYFGCTDLISGRSLFVHCLFRCSELTPSDKHWPDLKQPLRPRWDVAATENGVRSNQRCCHDYVQSSPTCNQATGSACHKADVTVAGRLNAGRLDRKLGGRWGRWGQV